MEHKMTVHRLGNIIYQYSNQTKKYYIFQLKHLQQL
jgi:hypothetical protein